MCEIISPLRECDERCGPTCSTGTATRRCSSKEGGSKQHPPAFNIQLCEKFRLLPLEFDGVNDSLYHPFDADGNQHMEYVNYRGAYLDAPLDEIARTFEEQYSLEGSRSELGSASFDADVEGENGANSN